MYSTGMFTSCPAGSDRAIPRWTGILALCVPLLCGCAGTVPVEQGYESQPYNAISLEEIRDVPRADSALIDGGKLWLSFTRAAGQMQAVATLDPVTERRLPVGKCRCGFWCL